MFRLVVSLLPVLLASSCGGERLNPAPCEDPSRDALLRLEAMDGPLYSEVLDVAVAPEHLYLCTGIHALMVVDRASWAVVADPRPSVSITDGIGDVCQHVAASGDRALITHRGDEFGPTPYVALYDVGDPAKPRELGAIAATGSWEGAAVLPEAPGWYAAGVHQQGLAMLRETEDGLVEIARLSAGLDNVWDLVADGTTLFVADGSGVVQVDVSVPAAPALRVRTPLSGSVKDVFLAGDVVYAAGGADGVHLLDAGTLEVLGHVPTPGSAVMTAQSEGYMLVADWSEVRAYDVSAPDEPRLVATERIDPRFTPAPFSRVLAVAADGPEVFLGEWSAGVFRAQFTPGLQAPDLRFEGRTLELPKAAVGQEVARALILENEGAAPLTIARIEASPPFFALREQLNIDAGGADFVELRVRTETADLVTGDLRLVTNDPDECEVVIPLVANEDDLGVGDAFPNLTIDDLQTGASFDLASLAGKVVLLSYFATF
jgi:hypothetical protein